MTYDPENTQTYFYLDGWGMILCKPLWDGDGGYELDSIFRTSMAYKAWKDVELVYATRACVLESWDSRGKYFKVYRHPDNRDNDMSRDHILGLLLGEKFTGNDHMLKEYAKYLRWRISDKFCFTPDLWSWMKIIAGKWWWWPVFVITAYASTLYSVIKNKWLYKRAKFSEEVHQLNWYPQWAAKNLTFIQVKLRQKLYPTYVLENFAWQLYVLPGNVFVHGLRKLALKIVGRYNYLVRLLLGDKTVTWQEVDNYRQMTSWRWGVTLNETCDRHVEILKHNDMIVANRLEEDILKAIWEEVNG